jgi:hypothetical protein
MVIIFKASNLLRFAAGLAAISICAHAFSTDAQVTPDTASMSLLPRQRQLSPCARR